MAKKKPFFLLLFIFFLYCNLFVPSEANGLTANSSNFGSGCIKIERQALLNFKNGVSDPSGQFSTWIGEDCCKWRGVRCNNLSGNVIRLELSGLNGAISPSLLDLKDLSYLVLNSNNFQGDPIPEFIGSFAELSYLDLSDSSFSGLVPSHLGNLSNLRFLNLSGNENARVSDLNWITRLFNLQYLNLGDVDLSLVSTTWLQSVNMLPYLSQLHLPYCNLLGIPDSIPTANSSSVKVLNLQDNFLINTSIPQWLFNLSTLMDLDLMDCQIKGSISSHGWRSLCNLRALSLSYNELSGRIDEFMGSLSECSNRSLEILDLWDNQLNGEIPELVGRFQNLKSLIMGENSISGSVPSSIGSLSLLQILFLPANAMDGSIPDTIGKLSNLVYLDLSRNSWKGVLSETHFQRLTKLRNFGISSLRMSLAIDASHDWIPPFSLDYIEISDCDLGSAFPSWLKSQTNLSSLTLKNSGILGKIPDWLWKLSPQLLALDLSSNQFTGEVPGSLVCSPGAWVDLHSNGFEGSLPIWTNVKDLNLDDNMFSGPIPLNFCREMPLLRNLLLSGNLLSGNIPECISGLKNLLNLDLSNNYFSGNLQIPWEEMSVRVIDLSNNNLSGEIPSSICSSSNLSVLKLFGNHLYGEPFLSLKNCTGLTSLDLGENLFSGSIPEWIGDRLQDLEAFGLRGNMFSGNIPRQLCSLTRLHILDLANNNFSGLIPSCIGNLSRLKSPSIYFPNPIYSLVLYEKKMELIMKGRQVEQVRILSIVNAIDLSSNDLRGEIPEGITDLAYLGSLNLSWNGLTGKIPQKIRELKQLETLDLSCNKISGPIPSSMTSMTFLNYLNLSNNDLSGPIPIANQFQTFNDPYIYEGNSQLCGSPLPTKCGNSKGEDLPRVKDDEGDEDWIEMRWFYIGIAPGFVVGFWVVCGSLILLKSWRYAYFHLVDEVQNKIYLFFALNRATRSIKIYFSWFLKLLSMGTAAVCSC